MTQRIDDRVRPVLTAGNAEKVQRLANDLNISASSVVNMILAKLSDVEMKHVVTFRVEVRDASAKDQPGRVVRLRKPGSFLTSF